MEDLRGAMAMAMSAIKSIQNSEYFKAEIREKLRMLILSHFCSVLIKNWVYLSYSYSYSSHTVVRLISKSVS